MIFTLVESLSPTFLQTLSAIGIPDDIKRAALTKDNSDIRKLNEILMYLKKQPDVSLLLQFVLLLNSTNDLENYKEEVLQVCMEKLFPEISSNIGNLKALVSLADSRGFDIHGDKFLFSNDYANTLVSKIEPLKTASDDVKAVLFSSLLSNRMKGNIRDDDINYILGNFTKLFNERNTRDLLYKLDAYIWLKNTRNLERYSIPKAFSWQSSKIVPTSRDIDVKGGTTLGELPVDKIRLWLAQFEEVDLIPLSRYLEERKFESYQDVMDKYLTRFKSLVENEKDYNKILAFFKKQKRDNRYDSFLASVYVAKDASDREVLEAILSEIHKLDAKSKPGRTTSGTVNGLTAMRQALGLKANKMTRDNMKDYIEKIAREQHLVANFRRFTHNLDNAKKAIDIPLTYDKRLEDGKKFALDTKIIELLRQA